MPGFSVDLDRLNNVAATDLPDVISAVTGTLAQLNTIITDQNAAFDGQLYHDGTPYSDQDTAMTGPPGLAEDFQTLCDQIISGLNQLAGNLEQASTAVQEIANRYRAADGLPPYQATAYTNSTSSAERRRSL